MANSLRPEETTFIQNAIAANTAEIKLVNLALQNTQEKAVRDFANRLLQEHTQAYNELASVARKCEVRLPPQTTEAQETYQKLSKLHGREFDQAYLTAAVETYAKEVAADDKARGTVKNADLKGYVERDTLRTESRLQTAKEMLAGLESAKHQAQ